MQPLVYLQAAFTRLLPSLGQPLYGWFAKSADLLGSPLQWASGSDSTPVRFIRNHLPSRLNPEDKPVRNGLVFAIPHLVKPVVKRLAFNLETSRVNAALGQTLVPRSQIPICPAENFDSRSLLAPQMSRLQAAREKHHTLLLIGGNVCLPA
jgi:hypothetical protein